MTIWTAYVGPNQEALRELIKEIYPDQWALLKDSSIEESCYKLMDNLSLRQHLPSAIPPTVELDTLCELISAGIMIKRKRESQNR